MSTPTPTPAPTPATKAADAHVLLIEDDEDDIRIIRRLLARAPILIEVDAVPDGAAALRLLEDCTAPDLILLDINMPVMDGNTFLGTLRAMPRFAAMPVVVLTTTTDEDAVRQAYDLGANAVISKAHTLAGMGEIIDTIVHFWFRVAHRYHVD